MYRVKSFRLNWLTVDCQTFYRGLSGLVFGFGVWGASLFDLAIVCFLLNGGNGS